MDDRVTRFRNVLRDVQIWLTYLGHYQSGVDGLYGDGTRRALEEYQQPKVRPPTGLPDQCTLFELYR
jgi:peptidoglycan hydrolase-like protein with peptidoglycan-binding domain